MTSIFDSLPKIQICEQNCLEKAFKSDEDPKKVCLFSNIYRDESNNPFILPVIQKCIRTITGRNPSNATDLLSFCDMDEYGRLSCELLFGKNTKLIKEKRCLLTNVVSNSGAFLIGAEFLCSQNCRTYVIPSPDLDSDYASTFKLAGFSNQYTYRLPEALSRGRRYTNMIDDLEKAPFKCVVVIKLCNLDSTGLDPTDEEWEEIASVIKSKEMIPFIDAIFHGLVSGDTELDAWPLRIFVEKGMDFFVAQSFSLNMGLFLEQPANLIVVLKTENPNDNLRTQLKMLTKYSICRPPAFGALMVRNILGTPRLEDLFHENLKALVHKNDRMRETIGSLIKGARLFGEDERGVYLDLGLSEKNIITLALDHHIYLPSSGRISLAGLQDQNIDYVCKCLRVVLMSSLSKESLDRRERISCLKKKRKKKNKKTIKK